MSWANAIKRLATNWERLDQMQKDNELEYEQFLQEQYKIMDTIIYIIEREKQEIQNKTKW